MPQEGRLQAARTHSGPSVLGPKERRRRAEHAARARFIRRVLASAKARRAKRSGGAAE